LQGFGDVGQSVLQVAQGVIEGLDNTNEWKMKQLEQQNVNLKRLVAELSLQKLALRDIIAANGFTPLDNAKAGKTRAENHRTRNSSMAHHSFQSEDRARAS